MKEGHDLPVRAVLPDLRAALRDTGKVVLQAPPGAGKTTVVPLALVDDLTGRLVLLEPRRVAARAAAARLAHHLDEPVGATVGLTTRDERRTSRRTRIEVVTEGVILRRLQADPSLPDVDILFFDEFHERSIEADLALAFALDARQALRPDLRLLVASATLEDERVAALLGGAPVIRAEGRSFAVDIEHRDAPGPRRLAADVADAAIDLLPTGDVLVFLPGAREIRAAARVLEEMTPTHEGRSVEVAVLHGAASPEQQDRAIVPASDRRRRIVLATDIAETSLTIEGVHGVVDAGLQRRPRHDPRTGLTGLVTVPASRASATQRAGRAGRLAPGRAIRLWSRANHAQRDRHTAPAILTEDLTGPALEVAAWGAGITELALLDQPPADLWDAAQQTLDDLGMLQDGRITSHGREVAVLPVHPRLGHLLVAGRDLGLADLACDLAALLMDRDVLVGDDGPPPADLVLRVEVLRGRNAPSGARVRRGAMVRARREARRLRAQLRATGDSSGDTDCGDAHRVGELIALAWPDRVAGRRSTTRGGDDGPGSSRGRFLLAVGRGAWLPDGDPLAGEDWLAVASVDRGAQEARIQLAAPIDQVALATRLANRIELHEEVAWSGGDVVAERRRQLGALVLERRPLQRLDPGLLTGALLDGLRQEGTGLLGWTDEDRQLQARVCLLHHHLGDPWPDVSDEALLDDAEEIIAPFLLSVRNRARLAGVRAGDVIRSLLAYRQQQALDRLCPPRLATPSGTSRRIDYLGRPGPVFAAPVQEMFGAKETPTVVDGQVPLLVHLLSPAGRPVQITDDLAGFWERAYPQVRAELRGRYPKHDWPEDPHRTTPTSRPRRR